MKYILIFTISFLTALPVFAAAVSSGSVPVLPPLLAPRQNVAPNFQNNIQLSDPAHPIDAPQQIQPTNGPDAQKYDALAPVLVAQPYEKSNLWGWILTVLAVILIFAFFVIYKVRKK